MLCVFIVIMSIHNYENLLGRCLDSLKSCKQLAYEYLKDDETISSSIREVTKEYCQANFEMQKADGALTKLRTDLGTNTNQDIDIDDLFKQYLLEDNNELICTDSEVWNEIFSGEDIAEVKQKVKKLSDNAYDRVDDSLLCSNVFEPPIDPITKTKIKDPYKNRLCGHIFEYEFILNYIKEKKNKAKCPYVGCTNANFKASDLKPDYKLKQQLSQYMESHPNMDDSSEDEQ
ncbi:hypothetical protein WA026_001379 [Henosepilachna vigintioctopunctata]|uniref:E3 SUMO-protein ligase NSE2 n=1 Tax=Henosepilachna vigintioctopunctata TaxID=420089 RepID=A0AAW1UQ69_9CUCU